MDIPVVYLGPSLPVTEAKRFLEADFRPPVRRGDLVDLPGGITVGIIDGVFDQNLAVSPREVRSALKRGITVFGSSSMGALRATEVPGVVGVGRVYEMFRNGSLQDDDEVAIAFDPETGRPLCEPMVNVRYAVERLVVPGTISKDAGDAIIKAAKSLPYRDRTYPAILRKAGLANGSDYRLLVSMLSAYDLKREDAITLLERLPRARQATASSTISLGAAVRNEEDDRQDDEQFVDSFAADAPVLFWEFDEALPFTDVVEFLALTGQLPRHARNAAARFVLQGNSLELDTSTGPSPDDVSTRVLDRLSAQWGFFTDEETRITLSDLGIGANTFEERLQEEIDAECQVMALVREGSAEFLDALRMELFLDRLSLKRATVRLSSLRRLAARIAPEMMTEQDLSEATLKLCALLDVRDLRDALREMSWWGVSERSVTSFLQLLARARRAARKRDAARRLAAQQPVKGLDPLKRRLKAKGEPRFSAPAPQSATAAKRLRKVVGITRVAMITGLSDIGIPNAQAFRPDGQFSSTVGSGKSTTAAGARIGAVMEEVEKWAQEQYSRAPHEPGDVLSSYNQLRQTKRDVVDPATLDLPWDSDYDPSTPIAWRACHDLLTGKSLLVPASALTAQRLPRDVYYSPRAGRKQFGTNGLASGFNLEDATCHALCEYIERHGDVMNEICGGNPGQIQQPRQRLVELSSLPASTRKLLRKIEASSRSVRIFDIRADVRVPTFRARICTPMPADEQLFGVTNQVAFGKACHPNPEVAVNMALLEAVQSVMTVTAGAREDLTVRSRSLGRHERTATITRDAFSVRSGAAEAPTVSFDTISGLVSNDAKKDIAWTVGKVRDAGYEHVLLCDLSPPQVAPARVVRVIVPGLETVNPFHTGLTARLALLDDLLPQFTPYA